MNIQPSDLKRLLKDSRESTLTELDELCFLRIILSCMAEGMSYEDALASTHAQLSNSINGE